MATTARVAPISGRKMERPPSRSARPRDGCTPPSKVRATTGLGENSGGVGGSPALDGTTTASLCGTTVVVVGDTVVATRPNVGGVVERGALITGAEFGM
jgi:hypothetical protein